MTDKAKTVANNTVWLANKTQRPIHIMQRGKDAEGNNLDNIRLSTMGAVEVSEETLNLSGVAQLLKKKSLIKVTEAQAKKLNKAHDAVVSQPEPVDDENEEDDDGDHND
ncbi:hypothetical protein FH968_17605 [Buttiauxella sp. B2]|uniref:hypothetical protein n=1 Tax=Buttiauxella sp. B2 TaxID=2587812 RepID=UPI00111ECDD3|nr:hypothetical protein [Buttiauxella sp. B2]TNV17875.1 hypothetical protein FH968_17605 [Buttiauxella sp. B2]